MSVGERRQEIRTARDRKARAVLAAKKAAGAREGPQEPPPAPLTPEDRIRRACSLGAEGFDLEAHAAQIAAVVRQAKEGG